LAKKFLPLSNLYRYSLCARNYSTTYTLKTEFCRKNSLYTKNECRNSNTRVYIGYTIARQRSDASSIPRKVTASGGQLPLGWPSPAFHTACTLTDVHTQTHTASGGQLPLGWQLLHSTPRVRWLTCTHRHTSVAQHHATRYRK